MGYKYLYVETKAETTFTYAKHREEIDKYAAEGWRYVGCIPSAFYRNNGQPKTFDLIFEKPE